MQLEAQAPVIGIPVCLPAVGRAAVPCGRREIHHRRGRRGRRLAAAAAGPGKPMEFQGVGRQARRPDDDRQPVQRRRPPLWRAPDRPDSPQDPARDATTLPLIRAALEAGLPLFCICRGFQELNVALGGTLHTQVHNVVGRTDHRAPKGTYEERYGPRHPVKLTPDGQFAQILGSDRDPGKLPALAGNRPPGARFDRRRDRPRRHDRGRPGDRAAILPWEFNGIRSIGRPRTRFPWRCSRPSARRHGPMPGPSRDTELPGGLIFRPADFACPLAVSCVGRMSESAGQTLKIQPFGAILTLTQWS